MSHIYLQIYGYVSIRQKKKHEYLYVTNMCRSIYMNVFIWKKENLWMLHVFSIDEENKMGF